MKKGLLLFFLALGLFQVYGEDWFNRTTPGEAKAAYEDYKAQYQNRGDYESAWKFAKVAQYYGSVVVGEAQPDLQLQVFTEGKEASEKAMELNPKGVEGYYYYATNLGSWGQANGIMSSLFAVKDMKKACDEVIRLDRTYNCGAAYMTRGRLYHKAPGFPISIGNGKKAEKDYKEAIKLDPSNRVAFRFYGEFLLDEKEEKAAKKIIQQGIDIPVDPSNILQEKLEIQILENLLSSI